MVSLELLLSAPVQNSRVQQRLPHRMGNTPSHPFSFHHDYIQKEKSLNRFFSMMYPYVLSNGI
jgi:hypothetical protein